jgi:hypothetical protein
MRVRNSKPGDPPADFLVPAEIGENSGTVVPFRRPVRRDREVRRAVIGDPDMPFMTDDAIRFPTVENGPPPRE